MREIYGAKGRGRVYGRENHHALGNLFKNLMLGFD